MRFVLFFCLRLCFLLFFVLFGALFECFRCFLGGVLVFFLAGGWGGAGSFLPSLGVLDGFRYIGARLGSFRYLADQKCPEAVSGGQCSSMVCPVTGDGWCSGEFTGWVWLGMQVLCSLLVSFSGESHCRGPGRETDGLILGERKNYEDETD